MFHNVSSKSYYSGKSNSDNFSHFEAQPYYKDTKPLPYNTNKVDFPFLPLLILLILVIIKLCVYLYKRKQVELENIRRETKIPLTRASTSTFTKIKPPILPQNMASSGVLIAPSSTKNVKSVTPAENLQLTESPLTAVTPAKSEILNSILSPLSEIQFFESSKKIYATINESSSNEQLRSSEVKTNQEKELIKTTRGARPYNVFEKLEKVDRFRRTVKNEDFKAKDLEYPGEERITIELAREHIKVKSGLDAKFVDYTKPPINDSGKSTTDDFKNPKIGIYEKWVVDSSDFKSLLEIANNVVRCLIYYELENKITRDNIHSRVIHKPMLNIRDKIEDLIARIDANLNYGDQITMTNSYGDSLLINVFLPYFLGHYLLLHMKTKTALATKIICSIVKNLDSVNGKNIWEYKLILYGPWLLAKYYDKSLSGVLTTKEYRNSRLNLIAVFSGKIAQGLQPDLSVFNSQSCWDCIDVFVKGNDLTLLSSYIDATVHTNDNFLMNVELNYCLQCILYHNNVRFGNIGLMPIKYPLRGKTFNVNDALKNSLSVMPFGGYFNWKTNSSIFTVKLLMSGPQPYFVNTGSYQRQALVQPMYQARLLSTNKTARVFFDDMNTTLPGMIVSKGSEAINLRDYRAFTAESIPNAMSIVLSDNEFITFAHQCYKCKEFGNYTVEEMLIVDTLKATVTVYIRIENNSAEKEYIYIMPNDNEDVVIKLLTTEFIAYQLIQNGSNLLTDITKLPNYPIKITIGDHIYMIENVTASNTSSKCLLLIKNNQLLTMMKHPLKNCNVTQKISLSDNIVKAYSLSKCEMEFKFTASYNQYVNVKSS